MHPIDRFSADEFTREAIRRPDKARFKLHRGRRRTLKEATPNEGSRRAIAARQSTVVAFLILVEEGGRDLDVASGMDGNAVVFRRNAVVDLRSRRRNGASPGPDLRGSIRGAKDAQAS